MLHSNVETLAYKNMRPSTLGRSTKRLSEKIVQRPVFVRLLLAARSLFPKNKRSVIDVNEDEFTVRQIRLRKL